MEDNSAHTPIVLVSARGDSILTVTLSFVLIGLSLLLMNLGYLIIALLIGGLSLVIHAPLLFPTASSSTMTLSFGGFSIVEGTRTSSLKWSDIGEFIVEKEHRSHTVIFSLSRSGQHRGIAQNIFLQRTVPNNLNSHYKIPNNYGFEATQLHELLNHWRLKGSKK